MEDSYPSQSNILLIIIKIGKLKLVLYNKIMLTKIKREKNKIKKAFKIRGYDAFNWVDYSEAFKKRKCSFNYIHKHKLNKGREMVS